MKAEKISIRYVSPSKLKVNPENARVHGSEVEFVVNSMEKFGFTNPILVDKKNMVIAGHGRLQAATRLGLESVPVIMLPFDAEESKAYGLIDNAMTDLSTWDLDIYDAQIAELNDLGWDMGNFGFTMPEFNDLDGDEEQETYSPEEMLPEDAPAGDRVAATKPESYTVMAFCKSKEEQDKVLAFLLKAGIAGQIA